jgi:hypothetical protein
MHFPLFLTLKCLFKHACLILGYSYAYIHSYIYAYMRIALIYTAVRCFNLVKIKVDINLVIISVHEFYFGPISQYNVDDIDRIFQFRH